MQSTKLNPCFAIVLALCTIVCTADADNSKSTPSSKSSYAVPLTLSYAIPTAIFWSATGLGFAYENANTGQAFGTVALVTFPVTLLTPGILHASYGEPMRGLGSTAGNLGGALLGGFIGMGFAAQHCGEGGMSLIDLDCKGLLLGTLAGMTSGRLLWAIIDVDAFSSQVKAAPVVSRSNNTTVMGIGGVF